MSTSDNEKYPMHEHIDENGNVYWHRHAPAEQCGCDHEHYHVDELGNLYSHVHDHGVTPAADHSHPHTIDPPAAECSTKSGEHIHQHPHEHEHSHTQTKAVINRLSRAIGHLESVKRMVENGRDCTEVLVQLAAVRSALSSTAKVILKDHLQHCISDAYPGNASQFDALNDAIDRFL